MILSKALSAGSLALVTSLGAITVSSQESLAKEEALMSRFQRTVQYLQGASLEERADFAAVALVELTEVYIAESDLARAEAAHQKTVARSKLLSWSRAVDLYANQLVQVLDDVEQGFPVVLRPDPQGPVTTIVADRAVILGHPRADQQAAYELRVLTGFCSSHDCQRMTVIADDLKPIPASAMSVNALWTFTESGPVCSNDGIELHFHSSQNLPILRGICEELMQEAATLVMELHWQRRHGVVIDWTALAVTATPGRPEHLVRLNAAGDSVLVTLPLLYSDVQLLEDLRPWILSRLTGKTPEVLYLDTGDYGWESRAP